jgi:hypothetical protein
VRPLFLTLLVALGFVAVAAEPRLLAPQRGMTEGVWQRGSADGFLERAPPARAPVRVTARSGHASPPSRLPDGAGGLLGEASRATVVSCDLEVHPSADAPCIGERTRRRHPEGRGPPRRPIAA